MTQAKAASLTSALFARKGAASPADLVIAELDDDAGGETSSRKVRSKERGSESAQRRKARLPEVEQDLPLLAFVDAKIAEEGPAQEKLTGEETAEDAPAADARDDTSLGDVAVTEDDHPYPAASLMTHRPLAFGSGEAGTQEDDAAENPASLTEEPEAVVMAVGAAEAEGAAEDNSPAGVPIVETAAADDVFVFAETDDEAIDAALPASPAGEALGSETEAGNQDDLRAADPGAAEDAMPQEETLGDETSEGEPSTDEMAAVEIGADPAAAEPALPEPTLKTPAEPEESPAAQSTGLHETETQGRERDAAATVDVAGPLEAGRRSIGSPANPKHRAVPRAAVASAIPAAKRKVGLVDSPWRMAAVIALGAGLGLLGYALWPQGNTAPEPVADAPTSDAATPRTAAPQGGVGDAAEADSVQTAVADGNTAGQAAERSALTAAAGRDANGAPVFGADPSFDVIRIEPNGQSIIAGRAAPFSEWILLNNGQPIGAVQADLNGEWVILPDASLIPGANDFSLVPKTERGKVAIPAAETSPVEATKSGLPEAGPLAPRSESAPSLLQEKLTALGQDAVMPLPRLKPFDGDAKAALLGVQTSPQGDYQIQIASVRQSAAAERERARLVDVYPSLLGPLGLRVQEASIDGAGVFYRLRSGPITDLADARELCRQLELRGQGCLVVLRSEDEAVPGRSIPDSSQPLPDAGLSPTQQAENPDSPS